MTSMQVEYSKMKESIRHNQAMEAQSRAELAETQRSHIAQETLSSAQIAETVRHNVQVETETLRHNSVTEDEIRRHNELSEAYQFANLEAQKEIAELNATTQLTVQQMKSMTDREINQFNNDVKSRIARADRAAKKSVEDARNQIEYYKASITDKKAIKELEMMQKQIDSYQTDLNNRTFQASAAVTQAEAAMKNALTRENELEEDKYMHDWQMQMDHFYASVAEVEQKRKGVETAIDGSTKIFNSAVNAGKTVAGFTTKGAGKTATGTLGDIIASKSKSKK